MYLLLGTSGCHLCEQATSLLAGVALTYTEIDIAEHPEWQAAYAIKIPVLYHLATGHDLCWPFNHNDLLQFISELSND